MQAKVRGNVPGRRGMHAGSRTWAKMIPGGADHEGLDCRKDPSQVSMPSPQRTNLSRHAGPIFSIPSQALVHMDTGRLQATQDSYVRLPALREKGEYQYLAEGRQARPSAGFIWCSQLHFRVSRSFHSLSQSMRPGPTASETLDFQKRARILDK